jgi:hypothetical protein
MPFGQFNIDELRYRKGLLGGASRYGASSMARASHLIDLYYGD